ncbi:MAG: hypothetical protein ACI8PZ_007014 [Myxococcota bacterium]|jgi:hypothetical protein
MSALLLILACASDTAVGQLVINEVMADNDRAWPDPATDPECPAFHDLIELYNGSDHAQDMGGLYLSDDPANPLQWRLPSVRIEAGAHLVLYASGEPNRGSLHAPFAVDKDGETLLLTDPLGRPLDRVEVPPLAVDESWGRTGDGADLWRLQSAPSPGSANDSLPDDPCLVPGRGFDDHSVPCLGGVASYHALADGGPEVSALKFDVVHFQDDSERRALFLDTRFYSLHDEWYIFRMLNGRSVPGETVHAPYPGQFDSMDAITDWAWGVDLAALFDPHVLRFTDRDRLTSARYYELVLNPPRAIGAGTLVHVAAREDLGRPEHWAFELEYADVATEADVGRFFDALEAGLPPPIADSLQWLVRSPQQEALGAELERGGGPYADRVLRYSELAAPGEVEVYRAGLVAGRVRVVPRGEDPLTDAQPDDILVLAEIPDFLPPCAALITTVPQTPLAHIALLAESRGIPNLFASDLGSDPQWRDWSRSRAKIALDVHADGFDAVSLTSDEWVTWLSLQGESVPELPEVDPSALPWTVDLRAVDPAAMGEQRAGLGGKSAGFVALLDTPGVDVPDAPLAVSVRAYHAHLDAMPWRDALLAAPELTDDGSARLRYLLVEGRDRFDDAYPRRSEAALADDWLSGHPPGDALGDLVRVGGVREVLGTTPIEPSILDPVVSAIADQSAELASTQGLRFRSSSNVEDIEGFNGAGLYDSATGFLASGMDPEGRTVESALQVVWASYWGFEAVEERHRAGVDHGIGGMGVLVHPRFDDTHELANAVITTTRLPDGHSDRWAMEVNAQIGAISVANPPVDACPAVLPERVRVSATEDGEPRLERLAASTEAAEVLSDATLLALFEDTTAVVDRWLDLENAELEPARRRSTLRLDLETREMADGWPARVDGSSDGPRQVVKQARSLEPSTTHLPDSARWLPAPVDVLARARTVERVDCDGASAEVVVHTVATDRQIAPDMGYADTPLLVSLEVTLGAAIPSLDLAEGDVVAFGHLDWDAVNGPHADPWSVALTLNPDAVEATGFTGLALDDGGLWLEAGDRSALVVLDGCVVHTVWASPETWLADRF